MVTPDGQVVAALHQQLALTLAHRDRVLEKRDRYDRRTLAHAVANVELHVWDELVVILMAARAGKTVQPS